MFYNVPMLYEGGEIDAHLVSLTQMTNSSTTVQLRNAAPLLYSICWQQLIFEKMDIQSMYKVKENKDAKRWEFQPTGNWIGYTVAFHEADNEADAWIAVYKAMKLEGRLSV